MSVPKDARELEAEEGRLILAARERMERARVELISAQAFLFDAIERRQERQALSEWP